MDLKNKEENKEEEQEESSWYLFFRIIVDGVTAGMTILLGGQCVIGFMCGQLHREVYVTAMGTAKAYFCWATNMLRGFMTGYNVLNARCHGTKKYVTARDC